MPIIACRASTITCSRHASIIAGVCATKGRRMNVPEWLRLSAWLVGCPLAISWLLTALLIRWAPRLGLVDYPSARKVHVQPTPRGGGLAIFAAVSALSYQLSAISYQTLLATAILLLGLLDDLRPVPWPIRLIVQFAVSLAALLLCL